MGHKVRATGPMPTHGLRPSPTMFFTLQPEDKVKVKVGQVHNLT